MKLADLLYGIEYETKLPIDTQASGISNDSRKIKEGQVYVAIRGAAADGHRFVEGALQNGAAAVVVDHDMGLETQIVVQDTHKAYALLCANYFGRPAEKMRLIGVTGTNGKTSVTTMIREILKTAGRKPGLIGTIQIEYGDVVKENPNTTPDAYMFHETLAEMAQAGCTDVVLEASSHALAQERLYGCHFAVAAFTNLTQDHLDYHKDMEEYFAAKKKLFCVCDACVVNRHDPYGARLYDELKPTFGEKLCGFSVDGQAEYRAEDIRCNAKGVSFVLRHPTGEDTLHFSIPGLYAVENAMTAIASCALLGIPMAQIVQAISSIRVIAGRSEILYEDAQKTILRDYAHTPDGIENILKSMKECAEGRLVALFGCGGDRDRTKRPLMAKACEKYADFIVVTSDNPRSEDPEAIIRDILPGLSENAPYIQITDRKEAIRYAIDHAEQGDLIVLLGKGHETYQILKDETIHFDEREIVEELTRNA